MQQFKVSNDAIAAIYQIRLPKQHELPPGYPTVRSWLANRVSTLEGKNKESWKRVKADPERLLRVRERNRQRARKCRERKELVVSHARTEPVK